MENVGKEGCRQSTPRLLGFRRLSIYLYMAFGRTSGSCLKLIINIRLITIFVGGGGGGGALQVRGLRVPPFGTPFDATVHG